MIEIGDMVFSSVGEVREYVHNLLINAPLDEPLSGSDGKLVHELFLHHPEATEKMEGAEAEFFKVGKHPQVGARAFCIVRTDGVEETFSMKKCVSARARVEEEKRRKKKEPAQQKQLSGADGITENVPQEVDAEGISGLIERFQRVTVLHSELGREIEQIKILLANESKR